MVVQSIKQDDVSRLSSHCLNITSQNTPDPFFAFANGKFYMTFTGNDRVPLWEADRLIDFWEDRPRIGPIWRPPQDTAHSARLWAPELHCLRGRWYVYYAAMDPKLGNRSHRMYVLGGPPATADPHLGPWEFLGPIKGMDQRQWAIDGTVFEFADKLYFVYSGWSLNRSFEDVREDLQELYIIHLSDPITAASNPVCISTPDCHWERTGPVGINEGPQWLSSPNGQWKGLVYSCGASWTQHYKMALLRLVGDDPLWAPNWQKSRDPLLQNASHGEGPFAPGHGCFLQLGEDTIALFHATDRDTDGNQGRKCRTQRVSWTHSGPVMGKYVGRATRNVQEFLGDQSSGAVLRRALLGECANAS
ncbi:Extracellular exo-alpha-(1-_5)-L-arabinofuranosidase [Pseudocercospora fuligena]|uniref:Extracellular exo-alpha-(1->5)-L-arabinofuranosidase n=1 Tax=Pseudocercospora fuligena TaxID=685502 RepID=A0A8H6VBG1_9PEZI|nr:Extracellular exo-alpha-(1->5)-L-arabinofuranosidase [Pseudocercospora fuligena]